MLSRLIKLPVMLVFILALLMYVVDATGAGVSIAFAYQGVISVTVFLFGLGIIALGGYTFRKANTTLNPRNPEKTTRLVTAGLYRYSRNPMYIGFLLWLLAGVIYFGNAFNLVLLPIFVVLVNRLFIRPEEAALAKLFGDKFVRYREKVRRWF